MNVERIKEKLREQKNVGVTKDGTLVERNPHNDGSRETSSGITTVQTEKSYLG